MVLPPVAPEKPRSRELMRRIDPTASIGTRELSQTAVLTAIFVVASVIPLTAFIGGAGFITLGIVFVPVLGCILKPRASLIAALTGSVCIYVLQMATAPVYGPYSLLVPTSGIFLGSVAFHNRLGGLAAWAYVFFGALYYWTFSGGTYAWLAPYFLVLVSLPFARRPSKIRVPLLCLYSTMCELTTMTMGSVYILRLPGPLWALITPFMFFERTVATSGSATLLAALRRTLPALFGET